MRNSEHPYSGFFNFQSLGLKMQLTKQQVEEYQELYKEIHGVPIDFHNAQIELRALVVVLDAVFRNYKKDSESETDSPN